MNIYDDAHSKHLLLMFGTLSKDMDNNLNFRLVEIKCGTKDIYIIKDELQNETLEWDEEDILKAMLVHQDYIVDQFQLQNKER